jgi:hypothetical protein
MMAVLGLYALVQAAEAQTIYKCTSDGKVSYGEQPCATGASSALAVAPAPSGTDAAQALERDKARLATLQKERALLDAREERDRARAARTAEATRLRCERLRLQVKWAEEDAARAGKEAGASARRKARRQAESLAVQCPA